MRSFCNRQIIAAGALVVSASAYIAPETTGEFATGAHDFEFTDAFYPSEFAFDSGGRRLVARAYYPVCRKMDVGDNGACNGVSLGQHRRYMEPGEWETFFGGPEPTNLTDLWDRTHSYIDASPVDGAFPVVIYTHGFGSWFSDNTALLEQIASHGYTVFAVNSPGFSLGVLFPNNETVSGWDYPEIFDGVANPNVSDPFSPPHSDDLLVRYQEMEDHITNSDMPALNARVRDDQLALADHLEEIARSGKTNDDLLLARIVRSSNDVDEFVPMGYSFGGSASGSSAQVDSRVVGAINMDGLQYSTNLFARAVRTPFLNLYGNSGFAPFYYNEFFYEPLETMGSNPNITRVSFLEPGVLHGDFGDSRHFDPFVREALMGTNVTVDGPGLYDVFSELCLGFLDATLKDKKQWDPTASFAKFADLIESMDVSYVADWASSSNLEEGELGFAPEESQDNAVGVDDTVAVNKQPEEEPLETASSSDASSAFAEFALILLCATATLSKTFF